jgi:hypothetical protein
VSCGGAMVRSRCIGGGGVVKMVWVGGGVVLSGHGRSGRSCQMTLQRSGREEGALEAPLESWSTSNRDKSYKKHTAPSDLSCGICWYITQLVPSGLRWHMRRQSFSAPIHCSAKHPTDVTGQHSHCHEHAQPQSHKAKAHGNVY